MKQISTKPSRPKPAQMLKTRTATDTLRDLDSARLHDPFLKHLLDSLEDYAVFTTDLSGKVNSWNKGAEAVLGYTEQEIIGQNLSIIFTDEDIKNRLHEKELKAAVKAGRAQDERWHVKKDGTRFWGSGLVFPLLDTTKNLIGFTKILRDLTEQRKAQTELAISDERFEAAFEQAAVGMALTSTEGQWLRVNQRLCNLLGYTKKELLKKSFQGVTHPDDIKISLETMNKLLRQKRYKYQSLEKRYIKKDGTVIWANMTTKLLRDKKGYPKYFSTVIENITKRKKAEAERNTAMEESTNFFNMPDLLLCIADTSGYFITLNSAWEKTLGYSTKELTARPWLDFVHPDDKKTTLAAGEKLKAGRQAHNFQNRYRCKDGTYKWLVWNVRPAGNRLYAAAQNINQIKSFENQLLQNKEVLQIRIHQQAVLKDLGVKALSGTQLRSLMDEAVKQLKDVLKVDYTKVLELLPGDKELVLRAGEGWHKNVVANKSTVDTGKNSQAGYTLLSNNPVIVKDLRTEKRFSGPALLSDHKVVSGMSCIIQGDEKPYGVLGIHSTEKRDFSEDDISFLQSVANTIAMALQRMRAEEQLRDSKEQLALAQQAANIGTFDWRIKTGEVMWTPEVEALYGLAAGSFEGSFSSWIKAIHPEDQKLAKTQLKAAAAEEKELDIEFRAILPDNSTKWIATRGRVYDDDKGRPERLLGIQRNITKRKLAEEKLRESEQQFRLIVQSVVDYAIFQLDPNGYISTWNEGARQIEKYEAEDIIGKHFSIFYPSEDKKNKKPEKILKTAAEKGQYQEENWRIRKDGSLFWAHVTITALKDDKGTLVGFSKITHDMTERKQAEEKLRYRTALLEAQNEATPDGILVVDTAGKILSYNQRFAAMWNIPEKIMESGEDSAALEFSKDQLLRPEEFVSRVNYLYGRPGEASYEELQLKTGEYSSETACLSGARTAPTTDGHGTSAM
ncbi:hypothetical protein BH23PAT1_BH23PAT1_0200 [soil metagenome]